MQLADADDQAGVGEDPAVRIAQSMRLGRLRCDRLRHGARLVDAVQAAVLEARAEDDPAVAEPGTAAVLVYARTHVEIRGDDIAGLATVRAEDQCAPSLFLRPAFRPVDPIVADVEVAER